MMNKPRRISEFLPEVLQTETLQKFFAATADHLFQPGRVEYLNAYVGQLASTVDPERDQYVRERSAVRTNYQVEPSAVSRDSENEGITHMLLYDDLINSLRFQGALVNDHNALFSGDYYSFGLPIDWDKFVNYGQYVWLPEGPRTITLNSAASSADVVGRRTYVYDGMYQLADGTIIDGEITPLNFTTGVRVKFANDVMVSERNKIFIVEGVGQSIRLIDDGITDTVSWDSPDRWDTTVWDGGSISEYPSHVLIARGSNNANPWSVSNRWFHRDVLKLSGTVVTSLVTSSAQRPIIEFDHSIKLWNFGTSSRGTVNLVDDVTTNINRVIGARGYQIDGVDLDDGMVVLFTNLRNSSNVSSFDVNNNNKLFVVSNLRNEGTVVLSMLPNGDITNGEAQEGDSILVIQGSVNNAGTHRHWTRGTWTRSQSRTLPISADPTNDVRFKAALNQAPLFELFDIDGGSISDPSIYAGSNFVGSPLFGYQLDDAAPVDSVLGMPVAVSGTGSNWMFDVLSATQSVQYDKDNSRTTVTGVFYWQQEKAEETVYLNNWFASAEPSRQMVVNQSVANEGDAIFPIDQMPAVHQSGGVTITVQVGGRILRDSEFEVQPNQIRLFTPASAQQVVKTRTWAGTTNQATRGFFEIPSNLQANPQNQQVTQFSISEILPHAHSMLTNQMGFEGAVDGANNWRDSLRDQSRGELVLQHRAPLLRLMALNSVNQSNILTTTRSDVDPMLAMQWAQSEYLRFYNKVINRLLALFNSRGIDLSSSADEWLKRALKDVNLGKTSSNAWANSGINFDGTFAVDQESDDPTWTPITPARMGITPLYEPTVFFDFPNNTGMPTLMMRCHNGAVVVLKDFDNNNLGSIQGGAVSTTQPNTLTHPVARAWMRFEQLMFASTTQEIKHVDHVPALDPRTVFSGKFRRTSYSRTDQLRIQAPSWERWLTFNQIDAFRNTGFDLNDAFTWNYSGCVDQERQPVPGHWRGIYHWFYDTDRPHEAPWEMLGFAQQPSWWTSTYGAAPYTSGNTAMWSHIEQGVIAEGDRQGQHPLWSRPGLSRYLPVNSVGQLLTPFEAGVVNALPSVAEAAKDWSFGDRSAIEQVWLTSADSDFLHAQWSYLARPAAFVEYNWNTHTQTRIFANQTSDQWIDTSISRRGSTQEFLVHRENPQDVKGFEQLGSYHGAIGLQHWISERLISDSRNVTLTLGDLLRGVDVNLCHRMGGFTDGGNIRILVDSFGLTTTDNLLLPQEDVSTHLLRSASTGEYVYSGVIVEWMGRNQGWRVIGYNSQDPFFEVMPSNKQGSKNTVVVDNQTVIEYKQSLNITQRVAYGTVFANRQDVYDFLISLGRAQEKAGWIFDQYDSTAGRPRDWSLAAREFLFWSQGPWAPGTYISLSPLATMAKFGTADGIIQNVGSQVNGAHSVLDQRGTNIALKDLDFLRIDDQISVKPLNDQGIYALRLYTTSIEHVLVFNNRTIFDDLIYDPLLNQRQRRFKLFGFRSLDWRGRLDAPGYLVTQSVRELNNRLILSNQIIPNFEKSIEHIQQLFETDLSIPYSTPATNNVLISSVSQNLPTNLQALAQHNIAYQNRPYLTDLLVDNSAAFQFYQGMIQQKGTPASIDRLVRNTNVVKPQEEFAYFEEWAFRAATYGYEADSNSIDIELRQTEVVSNPQLVDVFSKLTSGDSGNDRIVIVPKDARIVNRSKNITNFRLRTTFGSSTQDLPTAGYVLFDEVNHTVVTDQDLQQLYQRKLTQWFAAEIDQPLRVGDTVWQFVDQRRGWNVWSVRRMPGSVRTSPSLNNGFWTTVTTQNPHNLQSGSRVIMFGVINAGVNIDNTFEVVNVINSTQFDVALSSTRDGTDGVMWLYHSMRFGSAEERDRSVPPPGGWRRRDKVYVDGNQTTPWAVTIFTGNRWFVDRQEQHTPDVDFLIGSKLYDQLSLTTLSNLTLWNPVKNRLPGLIDREITFKTAYDPAQYSVDPSGVYGANPRDAWGDSQVGLVWWDLNRTRFVDYESGSADYSRLYWGKIAPGTTIDVWEWTRSPVPPSGWARLVTDGTDLAALGSPGPASGEVRNSDQPYVERPYFNESGQQLTSYYFWTTRSSKVPAKGDRRLSTSVISSVIENPENSNMSWWAPVNETTAVIANVGTVLNGDRTVWQINWLKRYDVLSTHKEYLLMRPGDPRSTPDRTLWRKMGASLVERDAVGNSVPDLRLKPMEKFGILERPNQTWFDNSVDARRALVQTVNQLLANSPVPPMIDRERTGWQSYFRSEEPVPPQTNRLAPVLLATTQSLDAYYVSDGVGSAKLVSTSSGTLVVDGETPPVGSTVLVKNQGDGLPPPRVDEIDVRSQNGIYVVVTPGSINESWSLVRAPQFDVGKDLYLAQTTVISGDQLAGSTWHQTSQNIQHIDVDPVTWTTGAAPLAWTDRVRDLAQLNMLEYAYPFGTRILVEPTGETANKWTIFAWTAVGNQLGEWQLARIQSYKTSLMWSQVDWYAVGHNKDEIPTLVVDTLAERDQLRDVRLSSIVKVNNIGDGTWELYLWTEIESSPWLLIGKQRGGILLSDDLWNYEPPRMGFGAGGFGADYQGFEYDSRLELAQIFEGLWPERLATQGLLKIGEGYDITTGRLATVNEPNLLFFLMLNRVFSEQGFVDWAFKTSFVNLRGFAQTLLPTELYTTNKINSLIEYVKETKPYHVKLRQFVDWRTANDVYQGSITDFDKPPYVDPNLGVRILDVNNAADQVLLSNPSYSAWFNNHQLSNDLRRVRTTRTRMIYDRVSCSTEETYLPGFDKLTPITDVITSLSSWISTVLSNSVEENQVVQVQVTQPVTFTRNTSTDGGLANWTVSSWGLDRREQLDQTITHIDDVFLLLDSVVPVGYTALVQIDDLLTWNWYQKRTPRNLSQQGSIDDWRVVAFQHNHGAALRIDQNYQPTSSQLPKNSPLLISGCASKLVTVDGSEFVNNDAWDKNTWDNVRGWDYSSSDFNNPELLLNSDQVGYHMFVGDGVKRDFGLRSAPQDPNNLKVWVNGTIVSTPQAWTMQNQISQILISNPGLAYRVHDVLDVQGGTGNASAQIEVTGINLVGAITSIKLKSPGSYTVVPASNPVAATGGAGVNASFTVRWNGTVLRFATPPSEPTSSRPNVWVVESGSTFNPAVSSVLDTVFDGGGLARPHLEAGHPEELGQLWPRSSLFYDVYTVPSAGWGNLVTKVYDSNGTSDRFDIGQSINEDGQVFVYVAGNLKTHGSSADYVINYQSMSVVFVNPPSSGRISIISIGFGGASRGLGSWSLINEGRDYQLFDTVTLSGGGNARVQITAVKAVTVNIVTGGDGYLIGDLLYYQRGIGKETLVARVTGTGTTSSERGSVTSVEIVNAGYYTNLANPQHAWFTQGGGTGVVIEPSWGAANLFVINRGIYQQEPGVATGINAVSTAGTLSEGSGLEIQFGVGRINQQIIFVGDGVTNTIQLNDRTAENQLLVTINGEATFDYGFDSDDPSIMVFPGAIPSSSVVTVTVFNSEVYSLKRTQTFDVSLPTLTYELDNPPGFVGSAGRVMVFSNLVKLRPPRFWRGQGDGGVSTFDVGIQATSSDHIKIWIDGVRVAPFDYDQGPGVNEITFSSPPPNLSVILVQVADDVLQDYDYEVEDDQLTLASWAVNDGDEITVITFAEDSQTSFVNDRFEGAISGVYTLSQSPLDNSSMQVFVNGVLANSNWDYEVSQIDEIFAVTFPQGTHSNSDVIQVAYPTRQPAAQPVAMRMFKNIYDDVKWYRLSDQASTRLVETLLWNSEDVVVEDGTVLSEATSISPGTVWIGSERIEYREKIVDATLDQPRRARLRGLQRGSMGTSTGITTDYASQNHSGDGTSTFYSTNFASPVVIVDGMQQQQPQQYQIVIDPLGFAPGTYVKFETNSVPPVGAQNILMIDVRRTITSSEISYVSGTLVRDASANQLIPGGHRWPHGNSGIQYSGEPQSMFLLQQPGTRKK